MKHRSLGLILGTAGTALVLLLAACLPALFVRDAPTPEPAGEPAALGARAELFSLYWAEDASCRVEALTATEFPEAELSASGARIAQVRADVAFDSGGPAVESAGEHFYRLSVPGLGTLRMREYYEQSAGDWSSWFRIYVDIDTLDVYFLYVSCKCLQNAQDYNLDEMREMDAWQLAEEWQGYLTCDQLLYLGGAGNRASALLVQGDRALRYELSYTFYTAPEIVVDYMIIMRPAEALPNPTPTASVSEIYGLEADGYVAETQG